jgi:hypothetical protein
MCWGAENCNCTFDLVEIVVTWKQRSTAQKFSEDTADTPHVKSICVVTGIQDNFWSSVPPGDDVFSQSCCGLFISSGQSEIANLEIAIFVEQQVAGLQVSVDDV